MTAPEDFAPEVVEAVLAIAESIAEDAVTSAFALSGAASDVRGPTLKILRTLRGLGVLAGPHECVVPREPTKEMQEAIWLAAQLQNANSQYRAMIAAAPRTGTEEGA